MAALLNLLARSLGHILKIDHSLHKEFKTIVISKYAGLGSIIQSTPLLQTLRANYPTSKLVFITTQSNAILMKHIHEIDSVLLVNDKNLRLTLYSTIKLIQQLWKLKPDLIIDLEFYSNFSGIVTTLSKTTNRLGFYNKDKSYRKGIYNYLLPFNINSPISETYLQFASILNCKTVIPSLKIVPDNEITWDHVTQKINIEPNCKYIIINPNASDLRVERRWPKQSFVKVIEFLLTKYPTTSLVLIGNKQEVEYVNEIKSCIFPNKNLINTVGVLNLSELIFLINKASLMLTNDTGPMHMAYALKTKTVSLFGPCSPAQYGAFKDGISFYKNVSCSPCVHTHILPPCNGNNICMKNISVNEVTDAMATLIL